jgi:hypothetical protein
MFDDLLGPMKPYMEDVRVNINEDDVPTGPDKQLDPRQVSASLGSQPSRGWSTGRPQKRPWRTT